MTRKGDGLDWKTDRSVSVISVFKRQDRIRGVAWLGRQKRVLHRACWILHEKCDILICLELAEFISKRLGLGSSRLLSYPIVCAVSIGTFQCSLWSDFRVDSLTRKPTSHAELCGCECQQFGALYLSGTRDVPWATPEWLKFISKGGKSFPRHAWNQPSMAVALVDVPS